MHIKLKNWLAIALLCCITQGWAQEQDPKTEEPTPPTNVEQSIEELFEPDKPTETEEAVKEPENTEPVLYISDTDNGRIVIMKGMDGTGYSSLGMPGYGVGRFLRPYQIWVDYAKRLYVADSGNNRVIRLDQSQGGWEEYTGLSSPMGVAVDKSGVYIADTKADRVILIDEVKEGAKVKETITHQQMIRPSSLWIDGEGALYICSGEDPPGGKIFKTWVEKERRRWTVFEGEGLSGSRFRPSGMVTARGSMKFVDESGQRIVNMDNLAGRRMKELLFKNEHRFRLSRPHGLGVDQSGNRFFIADTGNDRVLEVRGDGTTVAEFSHLDEEPTSYLRNPASVFVWSPAPAPEPEEEDDEKGKGKKKKKSDDDE